MTQKYTPSGATSFLGILKTVLFAVLACILIPLIYILINHWIPNIWFAAISAVMFGLGLGFFIDIGIGLGKIRNIKVAAGIAIFCGLLAYYMQWIYFDEFMYNPRGFSLDRGHEGYVLLFDDLFFLLTHPLALFDEIVGLNEVGTFRIEGSSNVSGALLWLVWFCEFAIVMVSVMLAVIHGKVSEPFSEQNDAWMIKRKPFLKIPYINDKETLISELRSGNLDLLKQEFKEADVDRFAEVILYESHGDPVKYITVVNTDVVRQKLAKDTIKKTVLVKHYPISEIGF